MRDGGKLTAVAYDRSNVKMLASGVVTVLDNQVDTTTGMVKLRAQFDNQDEALFPNQFVNIRLLVDTLQNAIAAPTAAIQHGAPGDYAYVVAPDGKASVRVLKLGQTDGDYVAVTSGLSAGDVVVVDGADRLREGAEVRVVKDISQTKPSGRAAARDPAGQRASGARRRAAQPAAMATVSREAANARVGETALGLLARADTASCRSQREAGPKPSEDGGVSKAGPHPESRRADRMNVSEPFIRRPVATRC